MRDWQNFFTAEEFKEIICYDQSECVKKFEISQWVQNTIADMANTILREEIAKAPVVYGTPLGDDCEYWGKCESETADDTHKGRLIAIEEIKGEK